MYNVLYDILYSVLPLLRSFLGATSGAGSDSALAAGLTRFAMLVGCRCGGRWCLWLARSEMKSTL